MSLMSSARSVVAAMSTLGLCVLGTALSPAARAEPAGPWPAQVNAVYSITFNGFDIGTFEFNSAVNGQAYALTGDAKL